jgi:hypothetical protein
MKSFISIITLIFSIQVPVVAAMTDLTLPNNYKSDIIKVAQRRQDVSFLGDIIRTERRSDALNTCYGRAEKSGKTKRKVMLVPVEGESKAWHCLSVKVENKK